MRNDALLDINIPDFPLLRKGKVRHVYDLGDTLLIVATDRISAFDHIMPNGVPDKGKILSHISQFWFRKLGESFDHHFISDSVDDYPEALQAYKADLEGRSMLVKKAELIPIECVVRGYLVGSGWKEYQDNGQVCGHILPEGLKQADKLSTPIFTPAIKATDGHDENIPIAKMESLIGKALTQILIEKSMALYKMGHDFAKDHGIILADTKFEFGLVGDTVILIDEVLTPDSSRYWPEEDYAVGMSPPSYDKQILRDYLESIHWNKEAPAPELPEAVTTKIKNRYLELEERLGISK